MTGNQGRRQELMEAVFLLSFPPPFPSITLSSPSLSLASPIDFLPFPSHIRFLPIVSSPPLRSRAP